MAQIRKYQSAGTIQNPNEVDKPTVEEQKAETGATPTIVVEPATEQPASKKLGKFTINGRSIEGQLALDRLYAAYKDSDMSERGMYNVAQKAINDGYEAIYDPSNNTIKVIDDSNNDVTNKYIEKGIKASPSDGNLKRNWGATFNTKTHRFKVSGGLMNSVNMNPEKEPEPEKENLLKGKGWFYYKKDKDGKYLKDSEGNLVWDAGQLNDEEIQKLTNIRNFILMNKEDADKKYKYDQWGAGQIDNLRNYAEEFTEDRYNELIDAIKKGRLSEQQKAFLELGGWKETDSSSVAAATTAEQAATAAAAAEIAANPISSEWKGNPNSAKQINISGITKGADGIWRIQGDDYDNSTWYLGGIDAFKGTDFENGYAINGQLYTQDQVYNDRSLDPFVGRFTGINPRNYSDWYNQANTSGVRFKDDREWARKYYGKDNYGGNYTDYNYDLQYNPDLYDFFKGAGAKNEDMKNVGITDISGAFSGLEDGVKVYEYVRPGRRDSKTGLFIPEYVIVDPNKLYGSKKYKYHYADSLNSVSKVIQKNMQRYYSSSLNRPTIESWNPKGFATHATFMTSDGSQTNTIARGRNGKYYLYTGEDANAWEINPQYLPLFRDKQLLSKLTNQDLIEIKKGRYRMPIASNKNGGTLKLQFGGVASAAYDNFVDTTNLSEAKHDITSSHFMNGSDGGLTPAEKMQIGAAIGDLMGVGVSFIPVAGNIAGAATGAAASTTKFVADIKQDGFQGRDLGNYLLNLGLDATSLFVPAVGKTVKGAKALKVIKNLGRPIMATLALGGATQAAGVVKKILSDEKVTSKDMVTLFQGLSATVLGGSIATKVGKEAKTLAKEGANTINSALDATKKVKIGDTDISVTNREIQDLVGKGGTSKQKVVEFLNSKSGSTLDDAQITKAFEDLGLNVKGRSLFHPIWSNRVVTNNYIPDSKSTVRYFFDPIARNKALNNMASRITRDELLEANKAVLTKDYSKMGRAKAQTIARLAAERPFAFKSGMFTAVNGRYVMPTWANSSIPTGEPIYTKQGRWTLGGTRVLRTPSGREELLMPPAYKPTPVESTIPTVPMTKVISTPVSSEPIITPSPRLSEAQWNSYLDSVMPIEPIGKSISSYMVDMPLSTARTYSNGVDAIKYLAFKGGGRVPKFLKGGSPGKSWNLWKTLPWLSKAATVAIQTADLKRAQNHDLAAIQESKKGMVQPYRFTAPSLDLSPEIRANQMANEPLNQLAAKPKSSDHMANMALDLSIAQAQSLNNARTGAAVSAKVSENQTAINNTFDKNTNAGVEAANTNLNKLSGLNALEEKTKGANVREWWSNIGNTAFNEVNQAFVDKALEKKQLNKQLNLNTINQKFELDKSNFIKGTSLWGEYNNDVSPTKGTFEDWAASSEDRYSRYKNEVLENSEYKKLIDNYKLSVLKARRGAKLRPVAEELTIIGDASAKRSVQKMNDNLMKMLLQLIK